MLTALTTFEGIAHALAKAWSNCHAHPVGNIHRDRCAAYYCPATRLPTDPGGPYRGDPTIAATATAGCLYLASRALGLERLCLSLGKGRLCAASAENAPMGKWCVGVAGRRVGMGAAPLAVGSSHALRVKRLASPSPGDKKCRARSERGF